MISLLLLAGCSQDPEPVRTIYKDIEVYPRYYRFKGTMFKIDAPNDGVRKVTVVR